MFVNVLNSYRNNSKRHTKYHRITTIVSEVYKDLQAHYGKKYKSIINNAINDIKDYWNILSLEEYAKKLEDWKQRIKDFSIDKAQQWINKYMRVYIQKDNDLIRCIRIREMFGFLFEQKGDIYDSYWVSEMPYKHVKALESHIHYGPKKGKIKGFTASQICSIDDYANEKVMSKEWYLETILQISYNERYALREISDDKYTMNWVRKYIDNCRKDAETGVLNPNYSNKLIEIYNMLNQVGRNDSNPLVAGLCDVVDTDGKKDKKATIPEQQKAAMRKRVKRFHEALQIEEEKAKQMKCEEWRKYLRQAIKEALLDAKTITKEEAEKITQ